MKLLTLGGDHSCARGIKGPHYNFLEEFHHHWDEIDYLCPHHEDAKPTTLFGNVHIHPAPKGKLNRLSWLTRKGTQLVKEKNHSLISAHEYAPFINGFGARRITKATHVPHILEFFHIEGHPKVSNFNEWVRRTLSGFYCSWAQKEASAIRVMNQTQVPQFLMDHGVPKKKIHLIEATYIDTEIFSPKRIEKNIDLLFIGRLVPNKGLATLINALQKIDPCPQLDIIGIGPLQNQLKKLVAAKGLSSHVQFHGWVEDSPAIASFINRAKIYICSSFNEGGPRTALEAMACATPVVTTPVGMMPDIIEHKVNGLLTNFTSSSIAQEVNWLLKNPQKSQSIGEHGLKTARKFERKKMILNCATAYQKFAKKIS